MCTSIQDFKNQIQVILIDINERNLFHDFFFHFTYFCILMFIVDDNNKKKMFSFTVHEVAFVRCLHQYDSLNLKLPPNSIRKLQNSILKCHIEKGFIFVTNCLLFVKVYDQLCSLFPWGKWTIVLKQTIC